MIDKQKMISTKLTKEALDILRRLKIDMELKTTSAVIKELVKIMEGRYR